MAEKLDKRETLSIEDLIKVEMVTSEALINLLERKGIITKSELLEEIKKVKQTMGIVIK